MVAVGAGSGSTAAVHTQSQLVYELIGNSAYSPAGRKTLTNTTPVALTASDVTADTYTDGLGNVYYFKITVQAIFPSDDLNNGAPFREYGLFSTVTLPGTPTGTSGTMFNRFVGGSNIDKDSSTQITVNITLRV